MNILIFSDNYPSKKTPTSGTFVYKFVQSIIKHGCNATVLAPQKFNVDYFKNKQHIDSIGEKASVYRPFVLSLSNRWIFKWNTFQIYRIEKIRVLKKHLRMKERPCDIIYCHFLSNALIAAEVCMDSNVPIVAAVGEFMNIDVVKSYYHVDIYDNLVKRINGFIAVSNQVREKLIQLGVNEEKIIVLPNATDRTIFRPYNKLKSREKFGLPQNKLLVLFVGRFIHNKGPLRLLEALNLLEGKDVLSVFVGSGIQSESIVGDKVAMKASLPYDQIPFIMSACDLFVLPTLHEGSSNVLVEAMACGLPIVSSDIPEIREQCEEQFTKLVDPMNVAQIKNSIQDIVFDSDKLSEMSTAALTHSEKFDLDIRTITIRKFLERFIR